MSPALATRDATLYSPSNRKQALLAHGQRYASERQQRVRANRYFYEDHYRYLRFLIPAGARVLDLGCGIGDELAALQPSHGVGVDLSEAIVEQARARHPDMTFFAADAEDPAFVATLDGPFDYIVISEAIGFLDDIESTLAGLQPLCTRDTRLVVSYYSPLWEPLLTVAERLGLKMPQTAQNWLSTEDIASIMGLAGFEVVRREWRQLIPKHALYLGPLVNRYLAPIPVLRRLCLRNYLVARPIPETPLESPSTTIVIPCRNEKGNIEPAVQRIPPFADDIEIIFVEGGSQDGTFEEAERVRDAYPDRDIKVFKQPGKGKADAVWVGFDEARCDILMILDADLTVPPETLPKFYRALRDGKGEFINGSRLVYPLEDQSMRFLNMLANRFFAMIFSWLLNQRFTDTLCGTKVLRRTDYYRLKAGRSYFGDFDPFGDFDLIFGAAKLNLKSVDLPIRYQARTYGETQISRFRHGLLLLRMVHYAFKKLKAF
ncbi:MAG: glycosyltransferase [Pseudomonadota bacterium]